MMMMMTMIMNKRHKSNTSITFMFLLLDCSPQVLNVDHRLILVKKIIKL